MRRVFQAVALAILMGVILAPLPAQDKKGDKNKGRGDKNIAALVQAGEVVGRISRLGSGGSLSLQLVELKAQGGGKKGIQIRPVAKEYELETVDDVIVRVLEKPLLFDDKGKPRPYTAEELKELKGPDPRLPGYRSEFDNLKVGQTVRIAFGRRPSKAGAGDQEKDNATNSAADRSRVGVIVVLKDAGLTRLPPEQKTKKK